MRIDDVNDVLEKRFLVEANPVLDNVISYIHSKALRDTAAGDSSLNTTPLLCLQTFTSDCLLETLSYLAHRALPHQGKQPTTANELLGLIILHTLCASYDESPKTVCDGNESETFFQMGIASDRYYDFWAALSGSGDRRRVHDYLSTAFCRSASRATFI